MTRDSATTAQTAIISRAAMINGVTLQVLFPYYLLCKRYIIMQLSKVGMLKEQG
jgi:hypothetical protein